MGGGITNLRRNAFTLIELLAIIVILAIIAVITVPIILNIIENSRKGAATDSAYGYKDSINKYYVSELSKNNKLKLDGTYEVKANGVLNGNFGVTENAEDRTIPIDGTKPSSGKLRYTKSVLDGGCLVIGDYKITFGIDGKVDETVKGDCDDYAFPTGESGQDEQPLIQYGFKSEGDDKPTIGTSGKIVTGKNVYFKYALTDGEVASDTEPEVCIYSNTYGGELCLISFIGGEYHFDENTDNIKTYVGYNTETWTYNNVGSWSSPNQPMECTFVDTYTYCENSDLYLMTNSSSGVEVQDRVGKFSCGIDDDGNQNCYSLND